MRVVICGAGQVGFNIARYLSYYNVQVTCIDKDRELIRKISDTLDIQGICGLASHPEVLERAGIRDADVFIAVTQVDEVNIVACEVVNALYDVKTKIARIRNQAYLETKWKRIFDPGNLSVDVVIAPESEVAKSIAHGLTVPGAFAVYTLCAEKVRVVGVKCTLDSPVVNTPIKHISTIFPDIQVAILYIARGDEYIIPSEDEDLRNGDEVYFCCETSEVSYVMQAFTQDREEYQRVMILGGGNIGLRLAQEIEENFPKTAIRIVEKNKERAEEISRELKNTVVLWGDALDSDILKEGGVMSAEMVLAVTADDQINTLSALLAKRQGAKHVQALINNRSSMPLVTSLGVDIVINPRAITISRILEHIRRGKVCSVHSIREGFGEIIEIEVSENSGFIGNTVAEITSPNEIAIGAIVRGDEVLLPSAKIPIQSKDRIVIIAANTMISKIEKLFADPINPF